MQATSVGRISRVGLLISPNGLTIGPMSLIGLIRRDSRASSLPLGNCRFFRF